MSIFLVECRLAITHSQFFLASQDALEVMYVSQWVSQPTDRDFTDVTLEEDEEDEEDEKYKEGKYDKSYWVMKCFQVRKEKSYFVRKFILLRDLK